MTLLKIEDVKSRVGQVIPGISGTLSAIYPPKSGTGSNGQPYQLQNIVLAQGFEKIKATLWNREELPKSYVGKEYSFEAPANKYGMYGLKVEENEYKGKKELVIKVSEKAIGTLLNGAHQEASQPVRTASDAVGKAMATLPAIEDGYQHARKRIMQLANLYSLARGAADWLSKENDMDAESIRTATSCLFIQAVKEDLDKVLPAKPITKDKPAPSPEEAEDDIPYEWGKEEDKPQAVEEPF